MKIMQSLVAVMLVTSFYAQSSGDDFDGIDTQANCEPAVVRENCQEPNVVAMCKEIKRPEIKLVSSKASICQNGSGACIKVTEATNAENTYKIEPWNASDSCSTPEQCEPACAPACAPACKPACEKPCCKKSHCCSKQRRCCHKKHQCCEEHN